LSDRADIIAEVNNFRKERRYEEGIKLLLDVLERASDIDKAEIYFNLGDMYYDMGDLYRAEYAYNRAIECNPKHINAHHNLGVIYKKKGKTELFIKMQREVFKLESERDIKLKLKPGDLPPGMKEWGTKISLNILGLEIAFIGIVILILYFVLKTLRLI